MRLIEDAVRLIELAGKVQALPKYKDGDETYLLRRDVIRLLADAIKAENDQLSADITELERRHASGAREV